MRPGTLRLCFEVNVEDLDNPKLYAAAMQDIENGCDEYYDSVEEIERGGPFADDDEYISLNKEGKVVTRTNLIEDLEQPNDESTDKLEPWEESELNLGP